MKRLTALLLLVAALAGTPSARAEAPSETRYPSDEALRHYLSARWLEEVGDLSGAGAEYARALALDPDDEAVLLRAAEVASRAGDPRRTLELSDRALAHHGGLPRALWLRGAALFNLNRADEALVPLRAAALADDSNPEYVRTLARVAETLDRAELVDSCYARLVQLDEDDAEGWFQLAAIRARLGRFAQADSALTRALDENPVRPGGLFLRGWIRERLGRTDEAIELYRHHLEAHDGDQTTRRRLVTLLSSRGRFREALAYARAVTAATPDDPGAYQVEADLAFRAGEPAEGERVLAKLRQRAPNDAESVGRSATVLASHGRRRQAVRLVDQWAAARPTELRAIELRAWVRAISGQPDSAVAWARLGVDANPDSLAARRLLARYLREARRYPEALSQMEQLRSRSPGDPSVLLDLGLCREQLGDVAGAIQAGRDALSIAPDAPTVLNFLGYVMADHGRDLTEAEKLIHRALEIDPDNGAYVDSMGWLLFQRGQFAQARVQLERAIVLTGGDPVIHEHLGDVYQKLNLIDMARQQYRLSLAGDSDNQRVRGKLEAAH